jgi:hypothetical protein
MVVLYPLKKERVLNSNRRELNIFWSGLPGREPGQGGHILIKSKFARTWQDEMTI